jgi:hypothetical protein
MLNFLPPEKFGLYAAPDGQLVLASAGIKLSQLEAEGKTLKNPRRLLRIVPTAGGVLSMQLIPLKEIKYFARLTTGDRVPLTERK